MRGRRKFCVVGLQEDGRHALSNINRAVSMKIAIEDRKRCNILANRESLKTVSQRRGIDAMKRSYLSNLKMLTFTKQMIIIDNI